MGINNAKELSDYILSLNFEGSIEEIQIQQVLALDKYIKDNIDYSFETIKYGLDNPNAINPYNSAYSSKGFFEEKKALCGGISETTNQVLKLLGIESEYIYGHFDSELYGLNNWGHRWNKIKIGEKYYIVDFTLNLCNYKSFICYDKNYNDVKNLIQANKTISEFDYIFNKELVDNLYLGGFKLTDKGHETNLDEEGNIIGLQKDLKEYFKQEISYIPTNTLEYYYNKVREKMESKNKEI